MINRNQFLDLLMSIQKWFQIIKMMNLIKKVLTLEKKLKLFPYKERNKCSWNNMFMVNSKNLRMTVIIMMRINFKIRSMNMIRSIK